MLAICVEVTDKLNWTVKYIKNILKTYTLSRLLFYSYKVMYVFIAWPFLGGLADSESVMTLLEVYFCPKLIQMIWIKSIQFLSFHTKHALNPLFVII